MLFNFLGAPKSGKTTIASMLFASSKEVGLVAEFSVEQARIYIAQKKYNEKRLDIHLTDEDQYNIMLQQIGVNEALAYSSGENSKIISDTSPFNSLLYMSPEYRDSYEVQALIRRACETPAVTYYAHPVYAPWDVDANRIHTEEQSKVIDQYIPVLIQELQLPSVFELDGSTKERLIQAQLAFFNL